MTGVASDFKIYSDEFSTGALEALTQNVDVLNATGAIRVITKGNKGNFRTESFFKHTEGLVSDRDNTSSAAVAKKKLTQEEIKSVIVDSRFGPVTQSLDSFRKLADDPSVMSFLVGRMVGAEVAEDYLKTALATLVAAIGTEAATAVFDNTISANAISTGKPTANPRALNRAKALFGDRQNRFTMIVGPAAVYNQLVDNQIAEKLGEVSGQAIYGAQPGTLNLPFFMTDCPALTFVDVADANKVKHRVLLLTPEAITLEANDYFDVHTNILTGFQNLMAEWQAESSYLVGVKGFKYTGAARTRAALATGANWEYAYESVKAGPGVMVIFADVE